MLLETGFVIGGAVGAGVHCTLIYDYITDDAYPYYKD